MTWSETEIFKYPIQVTGGSINNKFILVAFSLDNDKTWIGQPGGCEGPRQKGWTSIVVATLELNKLQIGIEYSQVGQGDNVIIMSKIPKIHPSMSDKEYIEKMEDQLMD